MQKWHTRALQHFKGATQQRFREGSWCAYQRACRDVISFHSDTWTPDLRAQIRTSRSQAGAQRQLIALKTTQRCSHTQEAVHVFQAARELSLLYLTCSTLLQRSKKLVTLENLTALWGKKSPNLKRDLKSRWWNSSVLSLQETVTFSLLRTKSNLVSEFSLQMEHLQFSIPCINWWLLPQWSQTSDNLFLCNLSSASLYSPPSLHDPVSPLSLLFHLTLPKRYSFPHFFVHFPHFDITLLALKSVALLQFIFLSSSFPFSAPLPKSQQSILFILASSLLQALSEMWLALW